METIEQAQNRLESLSMDGKNGFYRGVLWSQRWIPIEEELPEIKDKHYDILVKHNTNNDIGNEIMIFTVSAQRDLKIVFEFNGVVSWKPIEYK